MDQRLFARGTGALTAFFIAAVAFSFISPGSCQEQGLFPLNDACTCTSDQLRLSCTVEGSGVTVWRVTGCGDILLLSSGFSAPGGITRQRMCFGQSVVGMSVSMNNGHFTSELSLTAVSQLDGVVVQCLQNNGSEIAVGDYTITLVTDPYPTPSDISLTAISSQGLTFGWTTTAPNCSSVSYSVNATGCGNCPVSTNSTSVVCSDVGLSGESRSCDFQVQTVSCGNLVSGYSNTVTTVLQAPDSPMATVVPRYQQDSTYLASFTVAINQVEPVTISGYNITTQSYMLSYRTTSAVCGSTTITSTGPSCEEDICRTELSLSSSSCSPSSLDGDLTLSVSAASVLGSGPSSMISIARSSADFVQVQLNISDSSISCTFTNTQDTTTKTCSVSYGPCGGDLSQTAQANSSSGDVNLVRVQLGVSDSTPFCYVVTASNDTYTVEVEGSVGMATTASTSTTESGGGETGASGGLPGGAIAAIIIVLILVVGVAAIVVTFSIVAYYVFKRRRPYSEEIKSSTVHPPDEEKELDEINTSHVSEAPIVSDEKESHPPAENGDKSVKEEPPSAKETVENPTFSTTSTSMPLTVDNVVHKLSDYSSKWFVMGETLSLSEDQIRDINISSETDKACLRAMVEKYLQLTTVSHTWVEVDAALERAKEVQSQEIEKRLEPTTAKETVENPTYSTTSASMPLTVDNVVHKLSDYSSKWFVMGETLSLSEDQIRDINISSETDEACLRAMVEKYLQLTTVSHTWVEVDAALERAKEVQSQEIEERLKKHPDKVPVIIERHKGEEVLKETVKTLWIPKKLTIAQLGAAIRKPSHLDMRQEQSLYLNIGGKTVLTGTLDDLYTTHKHVDGYLHITYSSLEK